MKKTVLILTFLVCFINYQGFAKGLFDKSKKDTKEENSKIDDETKRLKGEIDRLTVEIDKIKKGTGTQEQGKESLSQSAPNTIPVTPKIVEYLLQKDGSSDVLKFYLSKPFTMKIYEKNETAEIEIINNMIILNPPSPANEKVIEFLKDSEGILTEFSGPGADKGRELKILFQEQGKTLVFSRRQNGYELSSVIINDKRPYKIDSSEPIQLYVSGRDDQPIQPTEVKVASVDFVYDNQPYIQTQIINANYNADYSRSAISSKNIMGNGSIRPQAIIAYAGKMKKSSLSSGDIAIINEYFKEAEFEGVNVDIAIAQMLFATDFFRNKQRISSCNYGGLSPLPQKNFNGSFYGTSTMSSMTQGIRAHIQHLKAYAKETPKRDIVDPRYQLAFVRGSHGLLLDDLYVHWTASPVSYRKKIESILSDLYR